MSTLAKKRGSLVVQVQPVPAAASGLPPEEWIRARLVDVLRTTGKHSTGYSFRFECIDERFPDAADILGTVWEPVHAGRPIHHWLRVLSGADWDIGQEVLLSDLVGADVEVYCEEETEPNAATGKPDMQVVDLREHASAGADA